MYLTQKKIATFTPLDYVIGVYFVNTVLSFLLLVSTPGPCFPLAGQICKFYAAIFGHWPIMHLFGLVLNFYYWVIILHMWKVMVAKRQININYRRTFRAERKAFIFFIGGASDKFLNLPLLFFGPTSVHFCRIFWNGSRDLVPLRDGWFTVCRLTVDYGYSLAFTQLRSNISSPLHSFHQLTHKHSHVLITGNTVLWPFAVFSSSCKRGHFGAFLFFCCCYSLVVFFSLLLPLDTF